MPSALSRRLRGFTAALSRSGIAAGPSGRRALVAELVVLGVAGFFRATLQYRVPYQYRVPMNLAMGAASLGIAAAGGATAKDMGLQPRNVGRGLAVGAAAAGVAAASTAALVAVPATRPMFNDPMAIDAKPRHMLYESVVRIPLGTALFEEALFRGALYGLERRWLPPGWRIPFNSLHFGLWHITEGIRQWLEPDLHSQFELDSVTAIFGAVVVTGAGGTVLCLERDLAGSLVAPVIGHSASNSFAYLGAMWVVHVLGEVPRLPEEEESIWAEELDIYADLTVPE